MKQLNFFYTLIYAVITTVSLFVFFIFLPYKFIDHNKTKILCFKNNASYEIGPNLIYILDEKPDPITEKNIRKLCEYAIINDSQDVYKTPEKINYTLSVGYEKEGSWGDVVLISIVAFLLMTVAIDKFGKLIISNFKFQILNQFLKFKFSNIIGIILGLILFLLFLYNPTKRLYCERQMASRNNNFKRSAYGYGLKRIQQEEPQMKSLLKQAYDSCLKK